jgi:hypothetical protein
LRQQYHAVVPTCETVAELDEKTAPIMRQLQILKGYMEAAEEQFDREVVERTFALLNPPIDKYGYLISDGYVPSRRMLEALGE